MLLVVKSAFGGRFQLMRPSKGNKHGFYTGHKRLLYLPTKKQFHKTELKFFFAFWNLLVDFGIRNCLFFFPYSIIHPNC
jgi:hypothetical protein